jgi:hypothetical protein
MTSRLRALLALIPMALAAASACGGTSTGAEPVCPTPALPAVVSTAQVLRLDSLNLGELDANGNLSNVASQSIGYNLDGICTTKANLDAVQCQRGAGADPSKPVDGTDGIDNAFGKSLLPLLRALYDHASATTTGFSYLALDADGRGTLYIGKSQGIVFVIPLVSARLSDPGADGVVTLAAVIPRDAFVDSVKKHFNLLSPMLCAGSTADSIVQTVLMAADLPLSGDPAPTSECDGISLAIKFAGAPVAAAPTIAPGCDDVVPSDGGAADAGADVVQADGGDR